MRVRVWVGVLLSIHAIAMAAMTRKTMATPKVTKMPVRCFIITWWRVRVRVRVRVGAGARVR